MTDIFADFNHNWSTLTDFHKSPQYQISLKTVQSVSVLLRHLIWHRNLTFKF
jgi:hypothetical protein